ncbi:MAG: phosphotransferase [Bacteroidaceae bacterium]|nr:phosphotransferase [Bacteroidaceae bacterium]
MAINKDIERIRQTYLSWYKGEAELITGSGSNRVYLRLTDDEGHTIIGVYGACVEENRAFVNMARHFEAKGLPVPKVIGQISRDGHFYLQEDLGRTALYDAIAEGRRRGGDYSAEEQKLLHRTMAQLPRMQFEGIGGLEGEWCYPKAEFDREGIMFDLNYFKYCFLKAAVADIDEIRLQREFDRLADKLLGIGEEGTDSSQLTLQPSLGNAFLYRDFQARNVMLTPDGEPRFIDFQGGRKGPVYYDLASFLWQAAARYPQALRESLIETYLTHAKPYVGDVDRKLFDGRLRMFVLFRLMQVLGAYGFRGYFERKAHFLTSIPPAIESVRELLDAADSPIQAFPYLREVLAEVCAKPEYQPRKKAEGLVVRVFSFSYKRGIPDDLSGNGGGYVFDCRSTHNPGRYEPYKRLTGLDQPVIDFLEKDGEILTFLESVYALADTHVERYLERGFTDLMFSFGCTGGQHRSVYSAEHLAHHLHEKYGVKVELMHREQNIQKTLE